MREKLFSILFLQQSYGCAERLDALSVSLKEKGYCVDRVRHIEEAITFLRRGAYDIFLMDISDVPMGECVGLVWKLRKLKTNLIAISDRVSERWYQKALEIGMSGIIAKPVDPVLLEDLMDKCVKIRRPEKTPARQALPGVGRLRKNDAFEECPTV